MERKMQAIYPLRTVCFCSLILLFVILGMTSCREESSDQYSGEKSIINMKSTVPPGVDAEIFEKLQEYLSAAHNYWNFQGAVLVARNGEVILKGGIGMADVEKRIPNTASTRFPIGSVTKTFTATAIMQLAEKELVSLDDPLIQYLPDYQEEAASKISIRHLLSHTSGVPEIAQNPQLMKEMETYRAPEDLVALFKDKPLDFKPGESSSYSNSGYVLLGMIIEQVSGQTYSTYIRDHLLIPLGMTHTGMYEDYLSKHDFAKGYIDKNDGNLMKAPFIHPSWGYAAGSLFSTVGDMLRWDQALSAEKVLARSSLDQMFTPVKGNYGYGWLIMEAFGRKSICHGGGVPGFNAWIERWPAENVFIVVLSNISSTPAGEIARSLAAILFGQPYEPPSPRVSLQVSPDLFDEYVGIYRIDEKNLREVIRDGDALMVSRNGGRRFQILPYARDRFFFPHDKGATLHFKRDESRKIVGQVFHQLGVDEEAAKIR